MPDNVQPTSSFMDTLKGWAGKAKDTAGEAYAAARPQVDAAYEAARRGYSGLTPEQKAQLVGGVGGAGVGGVAGALAGGENRARNMLLGALLGGGAGVAAGTGVNGLQDVLAAREKKEEEAAPYAQALKDKLPLDAALLATSAAAPAVSPRFRSRKALLGLLGLNGLNAVADTYLGSKGGLPLMNAITGTPAEKPSLISDLKQRLAGGK